MKTTKRITRYLTRAAAVIILELWIIDATLNRLEARYWARKGVIIR